MLEMEKDKKAITTALEGYVELPELVQDLATIAERRDEPSVTLEELTMQLKKDGPPWHLMELISRARPSRHFSARNSSHSQD